MDVYFSWEICGNYLGLRSILINFPESNKFPYILNSKRKQLSKLVNNNTCLV